MLRSPPAGRHTHASAAGLQQPVPGAWLLCHRPGAWLVIRMLRPSARLLFYSNGYRADVLLKTHASHWPVYFAPPA